MPGDETVQEQHGVGEVNVNAWSKAAMAKRVVRLRNKAQALQRSGTPGSAEMALEAKEAADKLFQSQVDDAAITRHSRAELVSDRPTDGEIAERLSRLKAVEPGTPEYRRRIQPPEPVGLSYSVHADDSEDGQHKARVESRVWAVDCNSWIDAYGIRGVPRFGKVEGDPMTDQEFAAVSRSRYPVEWDDDGKPTKLASACDTRDMPEAAIGVGAEISLKEATPEEREAARQYTVAGYIPQDTGVLGTPATEHVILPDPPVQE